MLITDIETVMHDDLFDVHSLRLTGSDTAILLDTKELKELAGFLDKAQKMGVQLPYEDRKDSVYIPYCVFNIIKRYDNFSGALLVKAIREYLLEICNTKEESINQLKANREEHGKERGYALYTQGWILPYYHQIMELYDRVGRWYDENDTDSLQRDFELHIVIAVNEILKEAENEVK